MIEEGILKKYAPIIVIVGVMILGFWQILKHNDFAHVETKLTNIEEKVDEIKEAIDDLK